MYLSVPGFEINYFISNEILYRRTRPIVNAPSSTASNKNKNEIEKRSSN